MAATPLFSIGDIVFIRESAALGFLEALQIGSIYHLTPNRIVYFMRTGPSPPSGVASFGDRVTKQNRPMVFFDESELIDQCTAIQLAIENAQNNLDRLQQQQISAGCEEDASG